MYVTRWLRRTAQVACGVVAAGALAARAGAGDLIPTPEFSAHRIPISMPPAPDSAVWEWASVALLLVALSIASYLALVSRRRRGLFLLAVASLVWFGFVRDGCICSIGATQNVAWALFDPEYTIPVTALAFFVLPLVFTLFFGRTFCAAVCPLGAVQELVAVRPVQVPLWIDHALGIVPYVYLGVAVVYAVGGTAFVICQYDPFVAMFRLSGDVNMLVFGACMLLVGLFVGRPYCRYLCPYGAVLGLLSKVSRRHATIAPDQCIQCRLCERSCPYGAIREPTLPLPPEKRPAARRRLAVVLIVAPLLVASGAILGRSQAVPLSRLDPEVRLAERIRLEDTGQVEGTTDASEAFRATGRPAGELYALALHQRGRFATLGAWLGAWVGLVIGAKLIGLSIRRRRTDYAPDRSRCVSCGRCYWYCPGEQVRLGLISDVSEMVDLEALEREKQQGKVS